MSAVLAAAGAGVAVWFAFPPGGGGVARLRAGPPPRRPVTGGRSWGSAALGCGVAAAVVALGAAVAGARGVVIAVAAVLVGGTIALLRRRQGNRRRRAERRADVVRGGEVIAGLLRAGRVPTTALQEAARDVEVFAPAAAEQAVGGDPGPALRRLAGVPGQEGLVGLASAWEVAARTGASLVEAVEATASALAADAEVQRVVAAELSASRAAGRVMALLPIAGLALGYLIGADPGAFLLGNPVGWACLVAGTALACAGVVWIDVVSGGSGGA